MSSAQDTIPLNSTHSFTAIFQPGYTYLWWYSDAGNDTTHFTSTSNKTEEYLWDVEGNFELFVQATDGNNCLSEIISKPFMVKQLESNLPQLFAVPDFFTGYEGTMITGNLSSNDFTASEEDYVLIYSLVGESIEGLILQTDGTFIYNAPSGFTDKIEFTASVCFEENTRVCENAEVEIKVVLSNPVGNTAPVAVTDNNFIFPNNIAVGNLLDNDYDPVGNENIIMAATSPVVNPVNGTVQIEPDGTFIYTPNTGFIGRDKFRYQICDNGTPSLCDSAWAYIFVNTYIEDERLPSVNDPDYSSGVEALAGNDTIIGNCNPYFLRGSLNGTEGFKYLWEPSELLDNPTAPTPLFTPGTTTTFKLTVTDIYGYSISDNVLITVSEVMANAGEDIYMEQNSTVILDGTGSLGEELQFSWTTIDGNIDNGANTANPVISGFGNYYLEVTDAFGCVSTNSVNVSQMAFAPVANNDYDTTNYQTEVIIPVLDNDTDEENSIVPSSLTITQSPTSGTAYVDFDNFTIHYRPNTGFSGEDNFEYSICNASNNCDEATVFVLVTDYKFLVPNAFSPNGDGINDYFEIPGIEFYEGNSITIFNRWGNKVYEAKNYGISTSPKFWDGKANTGFKVGNEELTTGTYYYILDLGNGEKPLGGSIYLDR